MFEVIGSVLSHPLIVVLAGGIVAAFVGQYLTQVWQSQRGALEQKNSLITDVSHELAKLFSSANLAEIERDSVPEGQTRSRLIDPIQDWTIFSEVIKSKLKAYYPSAGYDEDWEVIHESAYTFAHLVGLFTVEERESHVNRLNQLLDLVHSRHVIDLDILINRHAVSGDPRLETKFARSWRGTRSVIEELRDELAGKILTTKLRGESPNMDLWQKIKNW